MQEPNIKLLELRSRLQGSFLMFVQFFYPIITGREFNIDTPVGRESHYVSISRDLTRSYKLDPDYQYLLINMPPGHGKSTMLTYWVAWTMSIYPDSMYMYVSYAIEIATEMTLKIRDIISTHEYKTIFDIKIRRDVSGKEYFKNNHGGAVKAFGLTGALTGFDAGLQGVNRFSGALIVDDPHKLTEVSSDPYRERTKKNYIDGADTRQRGTNIPTIVLCQRSHEDDLANHLIEGCDGRKWKTLILEALDSADNVLCPRVKSKLDLIRMRDYEPYKFWTQYQQKPMPAGGALFKEENFSLLDQEPEMLCTFITADTAETDKTYNDRTVFSFWGLYKLKKIDEANFMYGLHWIDCVELSIEPKDLEHEFMEFWHTCCRYKVEPYLAAIEKKSTGSTLISILKSLRGIAIQEIDRPRGDAKSQRFLDAQPLAYRKLISFPRYGKHVEMCIKHMEKITINDTHRWDDIADTFADACRMAFINKTLMYQDTRLEEDEFLNKLELTTLQRDLAQTQKQTYGINYARRF